MSYVRGKHGKLTAEALEILEHEAKIRKQRTEYKVLAQRTGLSPGHVAKVIWNLMHGNKYSVPRGPKYTEADLDQFAADLMRK